MSYQEYFSEDTIAAFATALGGPLVVLRISGPKAFLIRDRLVEIPIKGLTNSVRKLWTIDRVLLDEAFIISFKNPKSFTGEDVVEFHLHGGHFVPVRVMTEVIKMGARLAAPGEFSFRAVRNQKMSLIKAQGVSDLIAAHSDAAASFAMERIQEKCIQQTHGLGEKLRDLLALSELGIDFSDQDVSELALEKLALNTKDILIECQKILDTYALGKRIQNGVSVALVGQPNVGKSSFFNALLGINRSIVSSVAGTTRDVVSETLLLQGNYSKVLLRFEDTAGLRTTLDQIEEAGIKKTIESINSAEIIIGLLDATDLDDSILAIQKTLGLDPVHGKVSIKNWIILVNKSDEISESKKEQLQNQIKGRFELDSTCELLFVSAKTREGIKEAAHSIALKAENLVKRDEGQWVMTRESEKEGVSKAMSHLVRAIESASIAKDEVLFSSDLRQALVALAPVIGQTVADDILGRIFSSFCIGK